MFRFIGAWLQVLLRYIAAWLQAAAAAALAAADKLDAASPSLQRTAAMDFPVTVSLGPLHRHLHSFRAAKNNPPIGVSEGQVRRLEQDLEALFVELKIVSEVDDPSFTARCWMKEVRELRYDAEDFFNEVPRPCAGAGAGRSALLAVILWIPGKLKRRRQVAQAFSDLRARAKDASRRRQSFQLGPPKIKPGFGQAQADVSRSKSLQLIGLEESMKKLVKLLALDDQEIAGLLAFDSEDTEQQVHVVPIFGVAGVGKTTLARTIYHNFRGKFQCRAFVRVSRNPDMRRMLSSMLSQIKAPPVHGFPDVQDLIERVREHLQCKRYLIVIDDLWASSTWDIISRAFPDDDCCSRIIVTTEIKDAALACSRYQFKYMYEMSPLNGDQSRQLFLHRVFGSESGCPPDFEEVTYEIIRKCRGLPLAIENLASMLACELNVDQWKHIRDSLPFILSSAGLKEVLNIIYDNLSPYLKTCLLYLIMYPEGNTISKEDLVKLWVAEDFISEGQDREKTAQDYFDELVSRGMIQPIDRNYNDEVLTCTVHHMVLDLIRYKSLEENFIINVSCFQTTPGLPDKVRRLFVQFGGAKCADMPVEFMMTQVRSLVYFGFFNCVPSIVEHKLLRVLILHIWADQSKIFDLTRINELFQLKYLKIGCNITVHLPDEIRQLKFLETLELHAPVNDMPSDISCLPLLRSLGYFDLSKNSLENVQSLGELNNLQNLHLTWSNIAEPDNLKHNMQCLGTILWKLSNLKSLTLVSAASSHADVLDDACGASVGISGDVLSNISFPPALLQRLELSGRCCIFSSLPEWTKDLGNLCVLKIAVRKLSRKDIDILKGLPALMALSLYIWTSPVGKVVFDDEGFSVLKYFKFTCAAPCMAFLEGAMPSVRELKLAFNANRMEQYSQIVTGLEHLIGLREITAKVGSTGAHESDRRHAESALSGAIANHPCTPIMRVQCVDRIFCGEEDTSAITQEQNHWTLEKQDEIQDELLDPLPEHLISAPSIQTQMRDGGQNEGTDRPVEVLTQEQEHWTPVKQHKIQEELHTQTRDGVQSELIERSMKGLTHEQEYWTLENQGEVQEEELFELPEVLSTPSIQAQVREEEQDGEIERSMEVLTQEQDQCSMEKQDEMIDGVLDVQIRTSMEVVTQEEHATLQKQHEIEKELLDPRLASARQRAILKRGLSAKYSNYDLDTMWITAMQMTRPATAPASCSTSPPASPEPSGSAAELSKQSDVFIKEIHHSFARQRRSWWSRASSPRISSTRSMKGLTHEQEHWTLENQDEVQEELIEPPPEVLSTPSTQAQVRVEMQDGEIEGSMRRGGAGAPTVLGSVLGHPTPNLRDLYMIGRKLGQGQLASTYLCTELATGVEYACKCISKRKLIIMEDIDDVRREIQIMHHLSGQKNIVTIKGAYEDQLHVHIVMELCVGGELFDRIIQRGHYSELKAAELIRIIIGVVEACHSLGVMHRNLKPENFLLANKDDDLSLKAIDFGLSVFYKPGQIFTDVVGTPYYVAPEVLCKKHGPEADVWTVGVILYILLSGAPPFWAETHHGIFDAVLKGVIDFDSDPWPVISDSAKDLIRRILNPRPAERFTAHEVLCHPWIRNHGVAPDRPLDSAVLSRIKQFSAMNKLKKMALRVIAESLPEEETAGLKEMFQTMDTDNSGAITYDELKEGLRRYGSTLKDTEIRDLMEAADVDNSGTIDYMEFISATLHLNKLEREEHLVAAFSYFDKDGNCYITVDDLQQAWQEHNMPDAFLDDVIKEADQDNDGRIDYREFVDMMTKGNIEAGGRTMTNSSC